MSRSRAAGLHRRRRGGQLAQEGRHGMRQPAVAHHLNLDAPHRAGARAHGDADEFAEMAGLFWDLAETGPAVMARRAAKPEA